MFFHGTPQLDATKLVIHYRTKWTLSLCIETWPDSLELNPVAKPLGIKCLCEHSPQRKGRFCCIQAWKLFDVRSVEMIMASFATLVQG